MITEFYSITKYGDKNAIDVLLNLLEVKTIF